jgi:hypothetical protein
VAIVGGRLSLPRSRRTLLNSFTKAFAGSTPSSGGAYWGELPTIASALGASRDTRYTLATPISHGPPDNGNECLRARLWAVGQRHQQVGQIEAKLAM